MRSFALSKTKLLVLASIAALTLTIAIPFAIGAMPGDPEDDPALYEPKQIGPTVAVAAGTSAGEPWALQVYPSDRGLCLELLSSRGSSGGCGLDVPNINRVGVFVQTDYEKGRTWIYGPTSQSARNVKITLSTGRVLKVETVAGSTAIETPLNFFIVSTNGTPEVDSVTAIDLSGQVLGVRSVN